MPIRLDRERRQSRSAGRNDKTSIDLLEHVQGGVHVDSLAQMRFRTDFSIGWREWSKPEVDDANVTPASGPRRCRPRRG